MNWVRLSFAERHVSSMCFCGRCASVVKLSFCGLGNLGVSRVQFSLMNTVLHVAAQCSSNLLILRQLSMSAVCLKIRTSKITYHDARETNLGSNFL